MLLAIVAVTKTHNGFCVAGVNGYGKLVRPICGFGKDRFWQRESLTHTNEFIKCGDLWELEGQKLESEYPNHTEDFLATSFTYKQKVDHKTFLNNLRRFAENEQAFTTDGEIAEKEIFSVDTDLIAKEEAFDGFYAVCTNLEDDAAEIVKVNNRRWEIEECFRIMKSEFKARPVYLSRDDRIEAHFTTCFISLNIYRLLEKMLGEKYTCSEIINGISNMNFHEIKGEGYVPTYTRTDFTDDLHEAFGFRTDYQIIKTQQMKKNF